MTVKCVICGKEFTSIKSTKKYCSHECVKQMRRQQWANRERIPKNNDYKGKEKTCLLCGNAFRPKTSSANLRSCCYDCMPDGKQLTRGEFLAKLKLLHGGKCKRCGYDACLKALEFHHIDPSKKDFTISNDSLKLADAIKESKKCILICSNCHKEFHDGMWDIVELNLNAKEEVDRDTY